MSRIRFDGRDFDTYGEWPRKAYGCLPFVDERNIASEFGVKGNYLIGKETSLLRCARFLWDENISRELRLCTEYTITTAKGWKE